MIERRIETFTEENYIVFINRNETNSFFTDPSQKNVANNALIKNSSDNQTKRSNLFLLLEEINKNKSETWKKNYSSIILKNEKFVFFLLHFFLVKNETNGFFKAQEKNESFDLKKIETLTSLYASNKCPVFIAIMTKLVFFYCYG